mgnify:CR=1
MMGETQMTFTPIKSQRAYAQVVEQIIDLIKRGEFPPGSQLPSASSPSDWPSAAHPCAKPSVPSRC